MPLARDFGEGTDTCSSRVSVTAVPFVSSWQPTGSQATKCLAHANVRFVVSTMRGLSPIPRRTWHWRPPIRSTFNATRSVLKPPIKSSADGAAFMSQWLWRSKAGCGASSTSIRSMTVHCSLARPRRATTAPRIARDASLGERLAGARRRSSAGRRLLLGRPIRSAAGHKRRFQLAESRLPWPLKADAPRATSGLLGNTHVVNPAPRPP